MSNSFLFIIPLTPNSLLTSLRKELQELCFKALNAQAYKDWQAIIIGADKPKECNSERFIFLSEEGLKEHKLQLATRFIQKNNIEADYIIRLDDDDLINPMALEKYKNVKADIIVDLKHYYIDWGTKLCSKDFKPWFPNTCLHKRKNALSQFGEISKKNVPQINDYVSLIETNHAKMHEYYLGKNVIFETESPIYLRVLNEDSITSNEGLAYCDYLNNYGNWNLNIPIQYSELIPKDSNGLKIEKQFNLKNTIFSWKEERKFIKQFSIVK